MLLLTRFGALLSFYITMFITLGNAAANDQLKSDQALYPGQSIESANRLYKFIMQTDGNLVLYQNQRALWSSRTNGYQPKLAIMQTDGNFVVYFHNRSPWATGPRIPGSYIVVQDDGNVVVYGSGRALWATGTNQPVPLAPPPNVGRQPPLVVFVNGYEDCCAWYMEDVARALGTRGAAIMRVPWDSFTDKAKQQSRTSNDAAFLQQGAEFINQKLHPDSELIIIGHSFGGDSVLKLLPRIKRRILFAAVIDPVAAGGLRAAIPSRGVPANVHYFFNRWQQNRLAMENVVPFDSALSGQIQSCRASVCDQDAQNIARAADGSPFRDTCGWEEVTCPGYSLVPPRRGTKQRRIMHNGMPVDAYIQRQIIDKVLTLLGWR